MILKKNWLWILLLALTATGITHNFSLAMAGLTVFLLAYLTKGIRRSQKPDSWNS